MEGGWPAPAGQNEIVSRYWLIGGRFDPRQSARKT